MPQTLNIYLEFIVWLKLKICVESDFLGIQYYETYILCDARENEQYVRRTNPYDNK